MVYRRLQILENLGLGYLTLGESTDSVWHYIESQTVIGQCLEKYLRESYILVGKVCFHNGTLETIEQAKEAFAKQLRDARLVSISR